MTNEPGKEFIHRHSAHCESGSTSNLLSNYGLKTSEALAFGIGAGLFFGYFPFIKVNGLPLISFRNAPGKIIRSTAKRLGVRVEVSRFKNPEKSMDALDAVLDRGIPVVLQAGIYWLPYFPDALRFHFNAHTLIAYGRQGNDYLLSDPVFDEPVVCSRDDLMKARFSEGVLAPKGKMYYLSEVPKQIDLPGAVRKGIKETCRMMIRTPLPLVGVGGIRLFAKKVRGLPEKYGKRKAVLYLAHAIRMQEEIGTGGGGFRLMYAAFLEEAAGIIDNDRLLGISKQMTDVGDKWREFALFAARICKNRSTDGDNFDLLGDIIQDCGNREYALYKELQEVVR
jgi:hypothetical protein